MLNATAVDEELRCYDEYMDHARGLASKTRSMALRIIGRLLTARFGSGAIDIKAIKPEQVRRFFAQEAVRYSKPASLASVVASLRGYFRYHVSLGDRVHGGLIRAIAYPANWQQSSLPKTLTTEEVEKLVSSLGQTGPSMRRADAIVRCALDLGVGVGSQLIRRADLILTGVIQVVSPVIFVSVQTALNGQCVVGRNTHDVKQLKDARRLRHTADTRKE
jgi:integrase/recombinase XerC